MPKPQMDWDPSAPQSVEARIEQINEVRARCPVTYSQRYKGQWDVLRYDDLVAIALDPTAFSNAGDARYGKPLPPLEYDPPLHGEFRRLIAPFFLPERIQRLEQNIRPIAVDIIDGLVKQGGGDLAKALSYPLPVLGLCALLDLPSDRWRDIKTWSENTLLADSSDPAARDLARAGHEQIIAFAGELIADRRQNPRLPEDDLTTTLMQSQVGGEFMDDELIARTLRIFISAGHNSTTSAIGNSLLYLAEHPDAQAELRADPGRIPAAVEEILRCDTPVQEMPRWAVQDTEISGCPISAGDRIGMFWGSGNRDPAAFPEPDRYILDRKPNRHLAFGQGIHTCLGAPMARMEIRVVLEEMLARTDSFEIAGTVERAAFHRMGVLSLPVKLVPALDHEPQKS